MGARGTTGLVPLALLSALALASAASRSAGAQEQRDRLLPGCGICYPGGYDVNTVGDVRGDDPRPPGSRRRAGALRLAGERERWVVLACPVWFWDEHASCVVVPGDAVTVRGSKTLGADGSLYLVAREIRPPRGAGRDLARPPRHAALERHAPRPWSGAAAVAASDRRHRLSGPCLPHPRGRTPTRPASPRHRAG